MHVYSRLVEWFDLLIAVILLVLSIWIAVLGIWFGWIVLFVPFIFLKYLDYQVKGRRYTYTEDGVHIEFGGNQSFYSWDEIQTRRLETSHLTYEWPYLEGGVFFSIQKKSKMPWTDPYRYCILHPSTSFYVNFIPEKHANKCLGRFEVDKEEFLTKLDEWGVKLTKD